MNGQRPVQTMVKPTDGKSHHQRDEGGPQHRGKEQLLETVMWRKEDHAFPTYDFTKNEYERNGCQQKGLGSLARITQSLRYNDGYQKINDRRHYFCAKGVDDPFEHDSL